MGFRERIRSFGRMLLLLFILTSVAFLSAITAMRFAIEGRDVQMPDLAGMSVAQAQALLQSKGLGLKVEDRIYSDLPLDAVVRQSPPPGIQVKMGQRVHTVLSLGPQRVSIPPLLGKSLRAARIALLRGGLQIGEISGAYLPEYPADTVLLQSPPAGTADATSPRVDFLVSLGPRPIAYVMPDLSGLSLAEAEQRLGAAGLKVSKINFTPLPQGAHGDVFGQTPLRGARVQEGDNITLEVTE